MAKHGQFRSHGSDKTVRAWLTKVRVRLAKIMHSHDSMVTWHFLDNHKKVQTFSWGGFAPPDPLQVGCCRSLRKTGSNA